MSRLLLVFAILLAPCAVEASEQRIIFLNGRWWIIQPYEPQKADVAADYKEFGRRLEQITLKMKGVVEGTTEKSDLRALEYLLRKYNNAVAANNWTKADSIKKQMHPFLVRGGAVASEAEKRKAERARADAERRHKEELRQRERHHREAIEKENERLDLLDRFLGW